MMSGSDEWLAFGELRGLLEVLAWCNQKVNHDCTFTLEVMPNPFNVQRTLEQFFRS